MSITYYYYCYYYYYYIVIILSSLYHRVSPLTASRDTDLLFVFYFAHLHKYVM